MAKREEVRIAACRELLAALGLSAAKVPALAGPALWAIGQLIRHQQDEMCEPSRESLEALVEDFRFHLEIDEPKAFRALDAFFAAVENTPALAAAAEKRFLRPSREAEAKLDQALAEYRLPRTPDRMFFQVAGYRRFRQSRKADLRAALIRIGAYPRHLAGRTSYSRGQRR